MVFSVGFVAELNYTIALLTQKTMVRRMEERVETRRPWDRGIWSLKLHAND